MRFKQENDIRECAKDCTSGIIRCKDCEYYADVFDVGRIFERGACKRLYIDTVKLDDYCSWAERKESNA